MDIHMYLCMDPMQSNKRPGMARGIVYNLVLRAGALTNMFYVECNPLFNLN